MDVQVFRTNHRLSNLKVQLAQQESATWSTSRKTCNPTFTFTWHVQPQQDRLHRNTLMPSLKTIKQKITRWCLAIQDPVQNSNEKHRQK
jgi:hypothetical protein